MDNRHNPCADSDYSYLVEKFGEEKIVSRYAFVYDFLRDFVEQKGYEEKVIISSDLIDHVVVDYFVDIDRLKGFQDIEYTNQVKIYAYLSFWLLRHKPLQLICPDGSSELVFVNEELVSALLRSLLFKDPACVPILEERRAEIDNFIKTMTYYFQYRDFSARSIEVMLLAFGAGRGYQYSVDYQK